MNLIRTRPSPSDLWDRCARLPAGPRLVLGLKSLVFLPAGKTVFVECLTRTGLRAPDGGAWSPRSVNAALDELLRAGLLTDDLACQPALLHPVAVDAVALPDGELLVAAVRRVFPARRSTLYYSSGPQFDGDALRRLVRLAIYANDEAGFVTNRDLHDRECAPHCAADLLELVFRTAIAWCMDRAVVVKGRVT